LPPDRDGGKTILTDPWFSTKENYYQGEPIAIGIPDLPDLDAVLITHAHYDHCDLDALGPTVISASRSSSPRRSSNRRRPRASPTSGRCDRGTASTWAV
jgi:glyoxylase-like metal-dependent hydrolase (beta-lactamase superfamily II)